MFAVCNVSTIRCLPSFPPGIYSMLHQFEPQTEPQTRPDTPQTIVPSATTPASFLALEQRVATETLPVPETVAQGSLEQTLAPAVVENWQTLLQEWKQETMGWRHYRPLCSAAVVAVSMPVFLLSHPSAPASTLQTLLFLCWFIFWMGILGMETGKVLRLTARQKSILNDLAAIDDTNAIGPLLEVWHAAIKAGQSRVELGKILLRLLPRLRWEDGAKLTPAQRRILYSNLSHTSALYHPEITLACLDAIEQIGGTDALPPLARLIVHDAPTQTEQRVRERAQQCLTHLTQNLDFGTTANIPAWIGKLPYGSSTANMPTLPAGTDEALIALFALIRLLPQLQPSDAGLLKAGEREYLAEAWRWMMFALYPSPGGSVSMQQSRLGSAFSFAVLAALEQIGTGRDLGLSHWLLCDVPVEELPQLRSQARRVNAILERRRDKEQVGQTLLRGASAPPAAPDELLRPVAAEHAHSDPKELLRPEQGKTFEG